MLSKEWEQVMSALTLEQCYDAHRLIRKRVGELSRRPSKDLAKKALTARTASVTYKGKHICGLINEITGMCVTLRLADDASIYVPIAMLDPEGFDKKITPMPADLAEQASPKDVPLKGNIAKWRGTLYWVKRKGKQVCPSRRLVMLDTAEPLPTSEIEFLT